jgi:NADPH-dependent ferric siderophore reductase
MLTSAPAPARARDGRPAYRPFRVAVRRVVALSPSFLRVTFTGEDLGEFGTAGLDQRIKLVLPLEADGSAGYEHLGLFEPAAVAAGSWYELWRAAPAERRNPIRTYTVRGIRPELRELDVDFAIHGDGGPASRWVRAAGPGDELVVVGPDDASTGWRVGLDWHPGACDELLLVGDETAVPAVCSILESLEPGVRASAFLEIPTRRDALDVALACPEHAVTWLPRDGAEHGARLVPAVRDWVLRHRDLLAPAEAAAPAGSGSRGLDESDVAAGLVWDSPDAADRTGFYAWIAGETRAVVTLRRFLVKELGVDRSRVAFMGYWRRGRAELS